MPGLLLDAHMQIAACLKLKSIATLQCKLQTAFWMLFLIWVAAGRELSLKERADDSTSQTNTAQRKA